ncbi:DUF4397 domain-containing protein [Desertivirga xinjiangensis]|uniref:DUF4397 domain-containing protein n=1 Tax=Desertivirga xinjiangensis TaxID=539206 RepID=UPI00210A61A6|nr:DUF4397 domain-containing protein [Pedobacter xinjiangensis]
MKHVKLFAIAIITLPLALSITSCLKDKDTPAPNVSGLSFINASPDAPSVNLFVDQNRVNDDFFSFGDHIDYLNAYSGNRSVYAYEDSEEKVSGKISMEDGKMYSLFLAGKWDEAEFILLEDGLTNPEEGKVHLRFLNMIPDAPAFDLGLSEGSTLISNKMYKENGDFISLEGDKKYNFVIRNHSDNQDVVSLNPVTLEAGHIYTIWASGLKEGSGEVAPGAKIIRNY